MSLVLVVHWLSENSSLCVLEFVLLPIPLNAIRCLIKLSDSRKMAYLRWIASGIRDEVFLVNPAALRSLSAADKKVVINAAFCSCRLANRTVISPVITVVWIHPRVQINSDYYGAQDYGSRPIYNLAIGVKSSTIIAWPADRCFKLKVLVVY